MDGNIAGGGGGDEEEEEEEEEKKVRVVEVRERRDCVGEGG